MITAQEGADHAIQLFLAGRLERASEVCRDVIEHYPDHAAALYLLGLIVSGQGDFERAESLVGRALACLFYRTRNTLDMARMVTGLLSDVSCIRGYVSGRGSMVKDHSPSPACGRGRKRIDFLHPIALSMPSTTTPAIRIKW